MGFGMRFNIRIIQHIVQSFIHSYLVGDVKLTCYFYYKSIHYQQIQITFPLYRSLLRADRQTDNGQLPWYNRWQTDFQATPRQQAKWKFYNMLRIVLNDTPENYDQRAASRLTGNQSMSRP